MKSAVDKANASESVLKVVESITALPHTEAIKTALVNAMASTFIASALRDPIPEEALYSLYELFTEASEQVNSAIFLLEEEEEYWKDLEDEEEEDEDF